MKLMMMRMTKEVMMLAATMKTSLGNEGTQSSTAGSYTTAVMRVNDSIQILMRYSPSQNVLILNETSAETSQDTRTRILVTDIEIKGYFPDMKQISCFQRKCHELNN